MPRAIDSAVSQSDKEQDIKNENKKVKKDLRENADEETQVKISYMSYCDKQMVRPSIH